jgi:4-amino-4-deoxy-L-arabinose transferase-like glycosyltransferase
MMNNKKYDRIFWVYSIAATIVRLLCIGRFELFYDEAFYWLCSRHLDLSYHVNTPLVNYIIRLFTAVGGNSEFFVRFGSTVLGFGIMLLIYSIASRIFNRKTGLLAVLIISFIPVFIPVGFIMVPDIPLIFFWLYTILLLWKIFSEEKPPAALWYMAGASLGLGLLAKDFMVLLIPSVLIYIILSKKNRFWLSRREPYLALVVTLVIVSPVIIWNFMHDFASVTFHLSDIHKDTAVSLIKNNFFYFIVSQAVIVTPIIFILLISAVIYAVYAGIKKNQEDFLYLACTSATVFGFFALWGIFTKVKPHWTVCGYLTAFIILAAVTERLFVSVKSKSGKALLILPFIVTFVPVILTLSIVGLTVTGGRKQNLRRNGGVE